MLTRWTLAAGLIAAFSLALPATVTAADLSGDDRYNYGGNDDDDPDNSYKNRNYSYKDRNSNGDDRSYERDYGDGDNGDDADRDYSYRGSTKDGDYLPPLDRAPRFSEAPQGDSYGCAPRWQVRNRLQAQGWGNFQRLAVRPRVIVLRAERPNGRAFRLRIDRCSGEIIAQRPVRFRGYGLYGPGPRRYGWAY